MRHQNDENWRVYACVVRSTRSAFKGRRNSPPFVFLSASPKQSLVCCPLKNSAPRYLFLDALRGVAALCVLFHHLFVDSMMFETFKTAFPSAMQAVLLWGACGVDIFFVLSGFVIAHSLRDNALNRSSLARFIVRRHIRLDLPYWTMLALAAALIALRGASHSIPFAARPFAIAWLRNALYLPLILSSPVFLGVVWTLCLEVQFYLLFVVVLWAGRKIAPRVAVESIPTASVGAIALVAVSGLACLVGAHFRIDAAWFWSSWQFFALGVLTYWACREVVAPRLFWMGVGVLMANTVFARFVHPPITPTNLVFHLASTSALLTASATAVAMFCVARRGALESWSGGAALQWAGAVSYSLYLTHVPVLELALRGAFHLSGSNHAMAMFWFFFVAVLCFCVAVAFHKLIEQPATRLAARFKTARPT